jgi:hypothetical protein
MNVHMFVFLLVVCLLLCLALLWRLGWFPLRPCSSRAGVKRSTLRRLLKPRCPDDCPACRLGSVRAKDAGEQQQPSDLRAKRDRSLACGESESA